MTEDLSMKNIVVQIVHLVITKQEYKEAAKLMVANNITINQLTKLTLKFSIYKLAKLTDSIKQIKKGN
ncbi:MAG: hypothetical protein ACNI25_09485 [Halarcobacter sp.]